MTAAAQRHYGLKQVGRSLRHFVIGKAFKVVSTFIVLILLARSLPEAQYAGYIALQGLVLFSTVFSHFGLDAVMTRFIPECRSIGEDRSAYGLLLWGALLRALVLVLLALLAWWGAPTLARLFGFQDWLWVLPLALAVGVMRLSALTISQAMESFLWQKEAQYSLAAGGMVRLGLTVALYLGDRLNLQSALIAELAAESLTFVLLCLRSRSRWLTDGERDRGEQFWWRRNLKRLWRFGLWSWLVEVAGIFYGSAPNRIVAAKFMGGADFAAFGFADNQANLGRRFLPVRLLIGLIRPVFMSRFAVNRDFSQLVQMANLVFRFNMLLFAVPIVLLVVVGEPVFAWLTAGKYGSAAVLLAGFLCVLILEGLKFLFSLLTQAVERTEIMLFANLLSSTSIALAFLLFPWLGVWAIIVASLAGVGISILVTAIVLARHGFGFTLDWRLNTHIVASSLLAIASGAVLQQLWAGGIVALVMSALVSMAVFALCSLTIFKPFTVTELSTIQRLLRTSVGGDSRDPNLGVVDP